MGKKKANSQNAVVNILFCGTGGQGVLAAAEVCGWAAIFDGYHVKKSEVHGMAQRGGSVESHLRFGRQVYAPLIPYGEADFLVSFYKDEGIRLKGFLKPKGIDISVELEKAHSVVADNRYLNIYLVGVLSQKLPIIEKSWILAIERVFAKKSPQENKKIFLQGRGYHP
jgi:indolepyruvate ferredoxin oxidoreductase beta subunit